MKNIILLLLLFTFFACGKEDAFELIEAPELKEQGIEKDGFGLAEPPLLGNVFAAIVNDGPCGSKYYYSLYVAATEFHSQDRKVQAIVVKNGAFVEAKVFTIPAGKLVSNNISIFNDAHTSYGRVTSKVYNVIIDHEIIDGYNFPTLSNNVNNCSQSNGDAPADCSLGLFVFVENNPSTTANEGQGDQDGDGICNNVDLDDNGNNIPDDFEDAG